MKQVRPHQKEVHKKLDTYLEKHAPAKPLVVMATGAGKTFTAGHYIINRFERILWVTHRTELIDQSGASLLYNLRYSPELEEMIESNGGFINTIRFLQGGMAASEDAKFIKKNFGIIKQDLNMHDKRIVIASIQTLYRRYEQINSFAFDAIVIDEAHLFSSRTYEETISYFNPKLLLGLTATPVRTDGKSLYSMFDDIVFEYGIRDGVMDGYLVEIDGIRCKTNIDLDKVHTLAGDFNQKELKHTVNIPERNNLIVDKYEEYASGKQAIFYCVDIEHALELRNTFRRRGHHSTEVIVSDKTICPNREDLIRNFKHGRVQIICNVDILTTGFDYPALSVIGTCCPTKSIVKYIQTLGRGTRPLPDSIKGIEEAEDRRKAIKHSAKPHLTLLDFVDVTSRHHIVNSWELDKKLPLDERVFMTSESKEAMEEQIRKAKIDRLTKQDEKVDLLKLPDYKISKSVRMQEPATEKQIALIAALGYRVDKSYTKYDAAVIIANNEVTNYQLQQLKLWGYEADSTSTYGEYVEAMREHDKKIGKKESPKDRKIGRFIVKKIDESQGPAF